MTPGKRPLAERNARLDFARTVLMCLVIAIHSPLDALNATPLLRTAVVTTLFIADGGFFTLSGYFLLDREFCTLAEYRRYYIKRLISTIVPCLLLNLIMDLLFSHQLYAYGLKTYLHVYLWNVLVYNNYSHLWFLYVYIPLALSAPFFAKLLNHMSKKELSLLAVITLLYLLFAKLITSAGQEFVFVGYIVGSWTLYFLLGHYLKRFSDEITKWRPLFYVLGAVCFCYIVRKAYRNALHPADMLEEPYYMAFIFAALILLTHVAIEKLPLLSRLCGFVAKHSFSVYLTHTYVIGIVKNFLVDAGLDLMRGTGDLLCYLCSVLFSILFAIVYDELIVFRIQDLLKKLFARWLTLPAEPLS